MALSLLVTNVPETYTGAQVGNNGCGSETVETVRRKLEVNFDTNSYVVKNEYFAEIQKLADFMTEFRAYQSDH